VRIQDTGSTPKPIEPTPLSEGTNRVGTGNPSSVPSGAGMNQTGDQATLGSSAVHLTQRALQSPEIRSELVAQFRAQIGNGTYTVDASKVAAAMLSDPQTGLGNGGRG
jgi:flagellar biosynthesis anti-sigma factor FlgM